MSVETMAPAAVVDPVASTVAAADAASSSISASPAMPSAVAKSPSKLPPLSAAPAAAAGTLSAGGLAPLLPLPAVATSVVHTALSAGVSPAFFRLVARLQTKFHRLKSKTASKLTDKLRQQKQRDDSLLASKLAAGRPIRGHKTSQPAFLGLPGSELPPQIPMLPLSQSPPPHSESPDSSTCGGPPAAARLGSRPTTPASSRGGDSIQRSPRLPNKAADLLFGSQKHVDKRADILGLSSGQIHMIDANPASQKALAMMGVASATGPQALVQLPVLDPPGAESAAAAAAAPVTRHSHGRTHSESSRALHAGLAAAQGEELRQAELDRIRAERDAGKAEKQAAAAAARPPESMTGKAQQILVGGTTGKSGVVIAPLPLGPHGPGSRPLSPAPIATNRSDQLSGRGNNGTKVLDKLGVTHAQLEHFPNHQSRAFNKLGVDVHLPSSMLTDDNERHVLHAKEDALAARAGEEAKEAARLEQDAADHAAKHQSSKKVTQLLHGGGGGRDKRLDTLGMTAKEMATFASQPKAFQKLGVFDHPLTARSAAAAAVQASMLPKIATGTPKGGGQAALPRNLQVPGGGGTATKAPVPRHPVQSAAAAHAAAPAPASSSSSPDAVRMMQKSASTTTPLAHRRGDSGAAMAGYAGRSESPVNAGANRRTLPSLAKGKATTPESRWRKLKAQPQPARSPTNGSIAALSRTGALQPGMSYSSSLASLKGTAAGASASSNASLARAYGANAVAATAGGTRGGVAASRENLFSVVMAAKKIRTAQGGMKTVIGGPGHAGVGPPLASIQSGKGVPSSLGQFSLQGVSATISPQPAEDDPASPMMKRRQMHSRGGMRGSTGGSIGAGLSPNPAAASAAGSPTAQSKFKSALTSSTPLDPYESGPEVSTTTVASRSKAQQHAQSPAGPASASSSSNSPEVAIGARRSLKSKSGSSSALGASTPSAVSRTLPGAHLHSEDDDAAYLANLDR